MFNMGPQYQDHCENNNCMALLSIQIFTVLLMVPFNGFLSNVLQP